MQERSSARDALSCCRVAAGRSIDLRTDRHHFERRERERAGFDPRYAARTSAARFAPDRPDHRQPETRSPVRATLTAPDPFVSRSFDVGRDRGHDIGRRADLPSRAGATREAVVRLCESRKGRAHGPSHVLAVRARGGLGAGEDARRRPQSRWRARMQSVRTLWMGSRAGCRLHCSSCACAGRSCVCLSTR